MSSSDWREANATNDATFDPEKDKVIEGKYVSSKAGVGPNKSMIYTIDTGLVKMGVWGSTVLDSKFEEISQGSMVKIEYLGKAEGKSGKEYKDFKVLYKEAPMTEAKPKEGDVIVEDVPEDDVKLDEIPF